MAMYLGRAGWEFKIVSSRSKGETWLREDYGVELGEPVCLLGTGVVGYVINKLIIKSYDGTAGAEQALGVSIDYRRVSSGVELETKMFYPAYFDREITFIIEGECMMKNVNASTIIEPGDSVIPANGGCERINASGQYTIGKSSQRILPGMRGMIIVKPDYESHIPKVL